MRAIDQYRFIPKRYPAYRRRSEMMLGAEDVDIGSQFPWKKCFDRTLFFATSGRCRDNHYECRKNTTCPVHSIILWGSTVLCAPQAATHNAAAPHVMIASATRRRKGIKGVVHFRRQTTTN